MRYAFIKESSLIRLNLEMCPHGNTDPCIVAVRHGLQRPTVWTSRIQIKGFSATCLHRTILCAVWGSSLHLICILLCRQARTWKFWCNILPKGELCGSGFIVKKCCYFHQLNTFHESNKAIISFMYVKYISSDGLDLSTYALPNHWKNFHNRQYPRQSNKHNSIYAPVEMDPLINLI